MRSNPYTVLLATYLRPQRMRVALLAVLLLGSIGLQLLIPQLLRSFIDAAVAGTSSVATHLLSAQQLDLFTLAIVFIAAAFFQQVVAVGATYASENVGWTATNALRADLAAHCISLDMPFHNARTPGEMIERIDGDVSALANFFSQFVIQIFGSGLLLLGVLLLLTREDWRMGLVMLLFVSIAVAVLMRFRKTVVPLYTAEREAFAQYFGFLEERLAGTEDIRSSGAVDYVLGRFYELLKTTFRTSMKAVLGFNATLNLSWVMFAIGIAVALALGAVLFQSGALTIGAAYLVFHYATFLQQPIDRLTREIESFQLAAASIGRVNELFSLKPTVASPLASYPSDLNSHPATPLSAQFDHVTFAYGAEPTLKDISFCLPAGRVMGLLGRTGSGKTTIARLLFRLYEPQQGAILLGSPTLTDIRTLPLATLRNHVGMVTQDVQLFHATVRDNLTYFDPNISDEHILSVINELGLRSWYTALPKGLDTELQSGNAGLSAGEAQLLAFTRVFLRNPGLVVLDEATSRLDRATEQLIERAMDTLLADRSRTAIIIAHRLSTVQRADDILILDNGSLLEHGERQALAANASSHFANLLRTGMEPVLA